MHNFKELGFKVGSSFIGCKHSRGINLETKLLEVRHMWKAEILLPWKTKLRFESDVVMCVASMGGVIARGVSNEFPWSQGVHSLLYFAYGGGVFTLQQRL